VASFILPHEAKCINHGWRRQKRGEDGGERSLNVRHFGRGVSSGQGHVPAKLIRDVRMPPKAQVFGLCCAHTRALMAGDFGLGRGGAERVEMADRRCGQIVGSTSIVRRRDGKETPHAVNLHVFEACGGALRAKCCQLGAECFGHLARPEAEGWLECRVKSVAAGRTVNAAIEAGKATMPVGCFTDWPDAMSQPSHAAPKRAKGPGAGV